jgi:hypothetical protein
MASKVTRSILEGYLQCKYKAHLKLQSHQGIGSMYEGLLGASRMEVRRTAFDKILARHAGEVVPRDIPLSGFNHRTISCAMPAMHFQEFSQR